MLPLENGRSSLAEGQEEHSKTAFFETEDNPPDTINPMKAVLNILFKIIDNQYENHEVEIEHQLVR